jgi:predicted Zn-dependent protease
MRGMSVMTLRLRFEALSRALRQFTRAGELSCAWVESEQSDYCRLNQGSLRQAGSVLREQASIRLVQGERHARLTVTLADALESQVQQALCLLREQLVDSEADPLLDLCLTPGQSVDVGEAPAFSEAIPAVLQALSAGRPDRRPGPGHSARRGSSDAAGELVGFIASGRLARGFCSSWGAEHWFERASTALDASIHLPVDPLSGDRRAVKLGWSGEQVDAHAIGAAIARAHRDAALLERAAIRLAPGDYRALLSPRALADLLGMLDWGGYSARAHHTGQSPLARLRAGQAAFSEMLDIREDLSAGFAPAFQAEGHRRPMRCDLIRQGRFADWLVSPATAREFGLSGNAANENETPDSLVVSPGTMTDEEALRRLETGVLLSNLWYLNFSDREACRVTGMTRFACLWVENGEPVAPIQAMRFDDSLFELLGQDGLEALGQRCERMPNLDTWNGRATGGIEAPSALLRRLRFAL